MERDDFWKFTKISWWNRTRGLEYRKGWPSHNLRVHFNQQQNNRHCSIYYLQEKSRKTGERVAERKWKGGKSLRFSLERNWKTTKPRARGRDAKWNREFGWREEREKVISRSPLNWIWSFPIKLLLLFSLFLFFEKERISLKCWWMGVGGWLGGLVSTNLETREKCLILTDSELHFVEEKKSVERSRSHIKDESALFYPIFYATAVFLLLLFFLLLRQKTFFSYLSSSAVGNRQKRIRINPHKFNAH